MSEPSLHGVYVAAITPRRQNGHEIDIGAAFELIDFLCSKRVNGIALLGSTGEFLHFDLEQRERLLGLAVKRSRVPVMANVSHSTLDGALELGRHAAKVGAAALLLMPPYFFRYEQEEIREFYRVFAQEMSRSIPLLLYNVPAFSNGIGVDTAVELLNSGSWAGIKDSSGDWDYLARLIAASEGRPFTFLVGHDAVFARGRMGGAHGVVSGVACAVPELVTALDRALTGGDVERRNALGARLTELLDQINQFPVPIGVKEATALRGIKTGRIMNPLSAANREKLEIFRDWFRRWLPVVERESQ